ncbi:hypothetical protein [Hoylesella saccharolytica]|uniref:hypothetical protein n=1 Tax=Hoylesella saccharolytica TaxID=633701 RepID=UPI00047153BB|nr:hypothetical protein [Hoylesella saccharolytica]
MKLKTILASASSQMLTLATVFIISLAFTACGSDKDDGPLPAPQSQTVTFDGKSMPVEAAEYQNLGSGRYRLSLYLNNERTEYVRIWITEKWHATGYDIDLAEKEVKHDGYYWQVEYTTAEGDTPIYSLADPTQEDYNVFTSGTLNISGKPASGNLEINLLNGKVKGTDDKEHTLTLNYQGVMSEFEDLVEKGYVNYNNNAIKIEKGEYELMGSGKYKVYFYLAGGEGNKVVLNLDYSRHIGKSVDLTVKEKESTNNEYWGVQFFYGNRQLINASGEPDDRATRFSTGILDVTGRDFEYDNMNIRLKNATVKNVDGTIAILSLNYEGKLTKKKEVTPPPTPQPKEGYVTLNLVDRKILKAEYEDKGNHYYEMRFTLEGNYKLVLYASGMYHFDRPINLGVSEIPHPNYWKVVCKEGNEGIIDAGGGPFDNHTFSSGTLNITGSVLGNIDIKIDNGVVYEGGYMQTLLMHYKGKIRNIEQSETPDAGSITLNGVKKKVVNARYRKLGEKRCELMLYPSNSTSEWLLIEFDTELHMGTEIDLAQYDEDPATQDRAWDITYMNAEGKQLFRKCANKALPSSDVFLSGKLKITGSIGSELKVSLTNGKATDMYDYNKTHTITVDYKGVPALKK